MKLDTPCRGDVSHVKNTLTCAKVCSSASPHQLPCHVSCPIQSFSDLDSSLVGNTIRPQTHFILEEAVS